MVEGGLPKAKAHMHQCVSQLLSVVLLFVIRKAKGSGHNLLCFLADVLSLIRVVRLFVKGDCMSYELDDIIQERDHLVNVHESTNHFLPVHIGIR